MSAGRHITDGVDIRDPKLDDPYSQQATYIKRALLVATAKQRDIRQTKSQRQQYKEGRTNSPSKDFIAKLDKGLDSEVAQGGNQLIGWSGNSACL